jgi:hypothetical protein
LFLNYFHERLRAEKRKQVKIIDVQNKLGGRGVDMLAVAINRVDKEVNMLRRHRRWAAVAISAALVVVSSCSRAPSQDTIKSTITEYLKHEVPVSCLQSIGGGQNSQVELIEIKQIGKFNEQREYWPIKARVKGTCQAGFGTERRAFDVVDDFKLYQDDYGNWKA